MKRTLMTVGLMLSVLTSAGMSQAHDKTGAESPTQPAANTKLEAHAGLTGLTAQVLQPRATLTERLAAARARHEWLASLIANHPDVVLRHALSAQERKALPAEAHQYLEEDLTTDGELEVLHEDGTDGSRYHYFVNRAEGRLALHFAADAPSLQTGDRVRLSGVRVQQAMALGSGTVNVTLQAASLPNTFGPQKTAVILVNFQDQPSNAWTTPAQVSNIMFATDNPMSVTNFYKEASYGQTSVVGDVYGIYTIPLNSGGCNWGAIANYAKDAAKAQVGATKIGTYERFVYAFPSSPCGWSGLGTVGGKPSQTWINGPPNTATVSHEMGHNFGLMHSHSLYCAQASVCSNGTLIEYGDTFDVMGSGWGPMHLNAPQKEQLGWLNHQASPPITTVQSNGTYTLDPYEPAGSNPKALKVQTPSGDWYYVEYRQALGFDASSLVYNSTVTNGVLVHLWSHNQNPDRIFLLNMKPAASDWNRAALEVGSTFSDPASGIKISTVWADDTVGVNVSLGGGAPACVPKNPTVKVSPTHQQAAAGTSLSYTVSVTNNDSGCDAASFKHQATVPAGWTASFTTSTLNIPAGASASTTLKVTSPASATAGSYTVSPKSYNAVTPAIAASTTTTYDVGSGGGGSGGTFVDNFNRGTSDTLGNGWASISGQLAIQDNRAATGPGGMHAAIRPTLVGATQTIAASFASGGGNSAPEFGLLARYQDAGNYYACYRRTGGTSTLRISRFVGGAETVLGSVAVANPPKGGSFTLGCQVQGTTLKLTLNGASKLTVSDSTFGTGAVGLRMGYRGANGASATPSWADDFSANVAPAGQALQAGASRMP